MWIPRRPLVQYGLRDIVEQFLSTDEVEEFAAWAFGEDYGDFLEVKEFAQAWNRNHCDLYMVDMAGTIVHDVYKMTAYFKKRNVDGEK